jgi:N-acetylmuramoyl-L-alanine amidase
MIYPRDDWNAAYGLGNRMRSLDPLDLIVIHHAASPNVECGVGRQHERNVVRAIERHHVQKNGWAGIGYSFLVFQSGNAYEGRGWQRVGAHTRGRNSTAYGICIVIDGTTVAPTEAALEACREIIEEGVRLGHVDPDYAVGWHALYGQTACPGVRVVQRLADLGPLVTDLPPAA